MGQNWIFSTPDYVTGRRDTAAMRWTIALVLVVIMSLITYLVYLAKVESLFITVIFWMINVVFFIWAGNRMISKWLDRRLPWNEFVSRRFFIQLLASGVYSLLVVNLTFYFFRTLFTSSSPDIQQMAVMNIYGLLFVLPAISIHFGVYFMTQWKKTKLRSETLEKENIRTQLEVLKSHIDPHFLFNNLNILSSLIDEDKETARSFLDHFAEVYRYVLKNKQVELVTLEEEMEFIDSYIYLLQKRFGKHLIIQNDIFCDTGKYMIPPLALQIVVENAIKHNKLDAANPLTIELSVENNKIVVKNNLQLKKLEVVSSKTGLSNIKKRFEFLSAREVEVLNIESHFIVKLPLLEIEQS